jgi:hypothetical protein
VLVRGGGGLWFSSDGDAHMSSSVFFLSEGNAKIDAIYTHDDAKSDEARVLGAAGKRVIYAAGDELRSSIGKDDVTGRARGNVERHRAMEGDIYVLLRTALDGASLYRLPAKGKQLEKQPYEMKSFDVTKDKLYVLVKDGIRSFPRP